MKGLWGRALFAVVLVVVAGVVSLASDGCSHPATTRGLVVRRDRGTGASSPRRALLIANEAYEHFGTLVTPSRDVRLLREALTTLGFEISEVRDATSDRLRGALRRFAASVRPGDVAMIYYAGHGASVGGHSYLVPVDFNGTCDASFGGQLEERALSIDELLADLADRQGRNLLFFDACRNNPCVTAARSMTRSLGTTRSIGEGLAPVRAPRDTLIVYASEPGTTALDDVNGNSPFARAVRAHLTDPIDIVMVVRAAREEVARTTNRQQYLWSQESLGGALVLGAEAEPSVVSEVSDASTRRSQVVVVATSNSLATTPAAVIRPLVDLSCPAEMLRIPGGTLRGERVDPFCMDRTEVTVSAYGECPSCAAPETGAACNWGRSDRYNHPVNCVDWGQANSYCRWLGSTLPTELEWEFGAVGETGNVYPWGDTTPSNHSCWARGASQGTCAAGSFPSGRSPFGLDDMSGNVWEWTSTVDGALCVSRGGGWSTFASGLVRATARGAVAPEDRTNILGFRCARRAM